MTSRQTNTQPSGVVVLGMHRSGTSAFAGTLAKAGFFAGKNVDLIPAASHNAKGYFERFDVNYLNDEILVALGGGWDNPPPRQAIIEQAPAWRDRVRELISAMAEDARGRPLVLKDPRISVLLPVWLPLLRDHFALVLVDRDPLEVAESMHTREGRPLHVGLALWQLYCIELLDGLAGQEVWFTRYESLLQNPTKQTSALLDGLKRRIAFGADGTGIGVNGGADAAEFVVGELRHERFDPMDADTERALTGDQLALRRWLSQLPEGWVTLDSPNHFRSQSNEVLASVAECDAWVVKPKPAPTVRGTLRLVRHHYHEGGLTRVTKLGTSEALRLVRRR